MENKKKLIESLAIQVKKILENEQHSYISDDEKKEIYKDVMNEVVSSLKKNPQKQVNLTQREIDKAEFDYYYTEWKKRTYVMSSLTQMYREPSYKALEKMGKRAIPFIYHQAKYENSFLKTLLEEIYGCNYDYDDNGKLVTPEEMTERWIKKMEQEGDI